MSAEPENLGLIGAGRVGTALGLALSKKGYVVAAVASRTRSSAMRLASQIAGCTVAEGPQAVADLCDLVFITTPDDAIGQVARTLHWRPGQGVVHCSGAESLEVLEPARSQGALVGAFHPLQTFASPKLGTTPLEGITFAIEASPPLGTTLEEMALRLGGRWVHLKAQDRVLYHVSAVAACAFLLTLVQQAAQLWETFGYREAEALKSLLPLVRETVENLGRVGLPQALTGPFVRGDIGTIRKHLEALEAGAPGFLHLYCHLALAQLPLAQGLGGLSAKRAQELQQLLESYLGQGWGERAPVGSKAVL